MGRHTKITLDDDTKTALELYRNGATLKAAAEAVYMSRSGLEHRFKVLGIPLRDRYEAIGRKPIPLDSPVIKKAIELYYSGMTFEEAANAVGISDFTLKRRFKVLGLQARDPGRRRVPPEKIEQIRQEYRNGKSFSRIAKEMGITPPTVRKYAKRGDSI